MSDVAKLAGVSRSTVSRVLSPGNATAIPISEETIQRVMDAVAQLSYRPNMTARSLRTQRTYLIAIMIADISNAFYHFIVDTVQDIAREHGYDVLIANTRQRYENEQHFCEAIMRRPVDGVILVPYHLTTAEIDDFIRQTGAAVVALGQHVQHPNVDVVYADDERATFEAVQWLIEQKGHRQVGLISVPSTFPPGVRRTRAYHQAMQAAGLTLLPEYVAEGDFTIESGQRAMEQLLRLPNPPSAVFASNDLMAIGAINAALDRGVRVPQDIAVVGFDNIPEATLIRPTLTTVAQFPVEIGKQLSEALLQRIEGQESGPSRLFEVPCRLIERQST